ncbi:hypothetical protein HYU21_01115 [Candidatus Woesearchaeota archaeon]|nr:hypothetical protein [Candidatus Woesearchaeota archaeon]
MIKELNQMNTLPKEDVLLFHKLMDALLLFVNQETGLIKSASDLAELHKNDIEKTMPLREKIFSDKSDFIERFIAKNPFNFSKEELEIIASWRKYKSGQFFVVKHLPSYSLFYSSDSKTVYGVKGILDSFEEKFNGYAPIMIQITLISFKRQIIYDGVFAPFRISFGGNMRKTIKSESEEAIQRAGIITSLDQPTIGKESNDEEMLRFYLKSSDHKMRYEREINTLKKKSKELEAVFYQEDARDYARHPKKMFKEFAVRGYFAVLAHSVVASTETEKELKAILSKILPEDKLSWIYTFKL